MNVQTMYELCKANATEFDGQFYIGVLTTGIYCLPSCKAKMPKLQNVKFYPTKQAAQQAGLRGCKRCRSEFYPNTQPEWFNQIDEFLRKNTHRKVTDAELAALAHVHISTIQRYFKVYMGTSVKVYFRILRLRQAQKLLNQGMKVIDVPYHVGYSSLSGFRSAYVKHYRQSPGGKPLAK